MTTSCVYLCLEVSEHPFYRAPLGNCLFQVQVAEFQPANTVKTISQLLFKPVIQEREVAIRRRLFIYFKSLKIICEEGNSPTSKFTKKTLFHILFHVFCLHFLRTHHE